MYAKDTNERTKRRLGIASTDWQLRNGVEQKGNWFRTILTNWSTHLHKCRAYRIRFFFAVTHTNVTNYFWCIPCLWFFIVFAPSSHDNFASNTRLVDMKIALNPLSSSFLPAWLGGRPQRYVHLICKCTSNAIQATTSVEITFCVGNFYKIQKPIQSTADEWKCHFAQPTRNLMIRNGLCNRISINYSLPDPLIYRIQTS